MDSLADRILELETRPEELERLYRADPLLFEDALTAALQARPDSLVLQAWQARFLFAGKPESPLPRPAAGNRETGKWIWLTVVLSLVAGTLAKLGDWVPFIQNEIYLRNIPLVLLACLGTYWSLRRPASRSWWILGISVAILGLFNMIMPAPGRSQTLIMSFLHSAYLEFSLLGLIYLRGRTGEPVKRMLFLEYIGEVVVYIGVILLGGMVLTVITLGLFEAIGLRFTQWYMENVVIYGMMASPLVATLLVDHFTGHRFRLAPLISRVFTPLFLITVAVFTLFAFGAGRSPFTERESLIAFNALLVVVTGISVLNLADRKTGNRPAFTDYLTFGLLTVTLVVDAIALSAIIYRLNEYGFSSNRITVLAANILIFVHMTGFFYAMLNWFRGRSGFQAVPRWVTCYLPVYTVWAAVVTFVFPFVFGF
jgi:hypothetical protein